MTTTPIDQIREAAPSDLPQVLCRLFRRPDGWKSNAKLALRVRTAIRHLGVPEVKHIASILLEAADALKEPPPDAGRLAGTLWEAVYR